jgi:hypothetical protein
MEAPRATGQDEDEEAEAAAARPPADDGYVVPANALLELPTVTRLPHPAGGELYCASLRWRFRFPLTGRARGAASSWARRTCRRSRPTR